jgi:hypothetical protein
MFKFHPFLKILLFSISILKAITFNLKVDIMYFMSKSHKMMQFVTILSSHKVILHIMSIFFELVMVQV